MISIPILFENLHSTHTDSEYRGLTISSTGSVMTVRIDRMIAFDKTFRTNPWFVRAVSSLCEIYSLIHDDPSRREIKLCKFIAGQAGCQPH